MSGHDGHLELRIADATQRDSGTYALRVSYDAGTVESRCDVDVTERERYDDAVTGRRQTSATSDL